MKNFFLNPLFLIGLLIRVALISCISPEPVLHWYVPFLDISSNNFSLNPWEIWIAQDGDLAAFPYGYVMWLCFLPLTVLFKFLGLSLLWGYGITLILADIILLLIFKRNVTCRASLLLGIYWLSPIVIIASYLLGFNDLIPVLFLVLSLSLLNCAKPFWSGFIFIVAVSAKLSMILALPFIAIYFLHNRAIRQFLMKYLQGVLISSFIFGLPFLLSKSGMEMLFGNPEMHKIFSLSFALGDGLVVYLVPLIYVLMLYATWQTKRLNYELFSAMLGTSFLLVVLMTPASPGWFIWAIPLLITYQSTSRRIAIILTALFSLLYMVGTILLLAGNNLSSGNFEFSFGLGSLSSNKKLISIVHTLMTSAGIILAMRIWRETVIRNDYFRLSRKPFVIGIAGDSGAGKDTFSDAIEGLFGSHSVTTLSGDDYHLWDRQKPMWQVMTHLNPKANDLENFANDLISLTDGKTIHSRHYDHQTGRMSRPFHIKSNDFILASGLHALYLPILRECYNLSIFLDIDESLRRHFKLQRDVYIRGHSIEKVMASFERREPDACRFIRPQANYADLVFSLQPIHPRILNDINKSNILRFKLIAKSRHGLNEDSLARVLVGICCLHVDIISNNEIGDVELTIEGETSSQDIALAAKILCPKIFEFLDIEPKWQDGVLGLMQLITLSHINQALTKRFI